MDKLKKALMIAAIVALVAIAGSMVYYFVFFKPEKVIEKLKLEQEVFKLKKTGEEIIKFDKEYYELIDSHEKKHAEIAREKTGSSKSDVLELTKKHEKNLIDLENNFKNLTIPGPLDDFYYKKLEELSCLNDIYFNVKIMLSTTNSNEDLSSYREKVLEYSDKLKNLKLESERLQREVYRQYGLDDLITKYQKVNLNLLP